MNKNFDIAYLRKYVNGELSDSEMYAIEKASHEDELLMDVLMGLEEEKKLNNPLEVADLHSAIFERTHPAKVRPIGFYRNLSIAASVLLALGIGTIWYLNRDQNKVEQYSFGQSRWPLRRGQPDCPSYTSRTCSSWSGSFSRKEEKREYCQTYGRRSPR